MNVASVKKHFANWRAWELNPIAVKELRQAVRNWSVTGMLIGFLLVLFIAFIGFLMTQDLDSNQVLRLGGRMFGVFTVILGATCLLFVPLYVGTRIGFERMPSNTDLLYVSTLSPAAIIRGKFFSGMYMAVLFFSACMPFMAFTNLLRGVDFPTVFFILSYLFLAVGVANMAAIFLACLPVSRPFKVALVLFALSVSITTVVPLSAFAFEIMESGVGVMMRREIFWIWTGTVVALVFALIGLFYVMSVALISPASANRALPVRRYITLLWLLGGVTAILWGHQIKSADPLFPWQLPTFLLMMVSLINVISNSDLISHRVRRDIPANWVKRIAAFLSFNGAAGGLVWIGGILVVTQLTLDWMLKHYRAMSMSGNTPLWFTIIAIYAFDYALLSLFVHRKFLSRFTPKLAGLIAVLAVGVWSILPGTILFFMNRVAWQTTNRVELGNIFNVIGLNIREPLKVHLYFAIGWLLIMLVLNTRWFIARVKDFHPPWNATADAPPPVISTTP